MKTLAELQEIERQLEKSLEAVREAMREQINRDNLNKASKIVADLYANGKSPLSAFGTSFEQISKVEQDNPELVCGFDRCKARTSIRFWRLL